MRLLQINILIFNCWQLLYVSKPRVHLQEDGCIYSYVMVRFTCISKLYHTCIYNRLPEDEPPGSKHIEDIKN